MRIQEKLENLVRLVTGNKFGAADEYINQIKNEYNQMAHERDQYKEMAENEKTAKKYALKHAEKSDEKVESQAEIIDGLENQIKALEDKIEGVGKARGFYRRKIQEYINENERLQEKVNNYIALAEDRKAKLDNYDAMFNQPMKLSVPDDTQVEHLVPYSELERERRRFGLLEKAVNTAIDEEQPAANIFILFHQLRQEGEGE